MKILIIGGGIIGASAAYHLSKKGVQVTLIDRLEPGQATQAAAGIICPWASQRRNKAWYALASKGAAYYPELAAQLEQEGQYTSYRKSGALAVDQDEQKLEKKMALLMKRRETAPEIGELALLDEQQTAQRLPFLHDSFRSVWIGGGAKVEGRVLRNALQKAAEKYGAVIVYGSASPYIENGVLAGVEVNGSVIRGDQLIVSAGAWAVEFIQPLGINLQVYGQKAQLLQLQKDSESEQWPVVMPPGTQYIVPFAGGRFACGATFEETADFTIRPTAGGVLEVLEKALQTAPGLAAASIDETRVGIRPHTPNFMPVIGALPGYANVWIANGLGSSGLTAGPLFGKLLSQLVCGEETDLDLSPYQIGQIIANDD